MYPRLGQWLAVGVVCALFLMLWLMPSLGIASVCGAL